MKIATLLLAAGSLVATAALAAPVTYNIDPEHTYPAFEADHMGGQSIWRGKFNSNTGKVVYDREAKSGTVDINIDIKSINFGHDKMNTHALSADMFDGVKFPVASFKGKLAGFKGDAPSEVQGNLTIRGDQAGNAEDQQLSMQAESDDQERSLRCRCLGHHQPRRFRRGLWQGFWFQDGDQAFDLGRSHQG
jgi:polyisoprenoid-binding protein YceI